MTTVKKGIILVSGDSFIYSDPAKGKNPEAVGITRVGLFGGYIKDPQLFLKS